MKKIISVALIILLVLAAALAWLSLGPATGFTTPKQYLEINTGSSYETVLTKIKEEKILYSTTLFNLLAKKLNYTQKVKAGRYEIKKGMSVINVIRMLRNGHQSPVNLVITKLRTKEDFAGLAGRKFEFDSTSFLHFLNNNDSLINYGFDTNTVMTAVLPNTYTYFWNTTPTKVFVKLQEAYTNFWTKERQQLAAAQGLTIAQVVVLASIVEEETNKTNEKGNIASVYMNRMAKGMRLGADPTVKFALKDFGLKRIYNKHLIVESPYNTYRNAGLPPGPICTPSQATIDAVLHAPKTPYLYFVAKADFSGYHTFAATYEEHLANAKQYQQELDKQLETKKMKEDTGN